MAVAMGADEAGARENIEGMFDMAENLGKLDYKKGLDSPDREEIIRIGSWFLPKDKESQWFAVGVRALKLMREPRDSESFSDLRRTVECWGPAGGLEKFDGIAGEK